jgi:mono/diheme cytochrome c family protein
MTPDDLDALSAYLFDLDEMPKETRPSTPAPVAVAPELVVSARPTYLALCSGCHGVEGQGIPHVVVPLATNASLKLASARNLVRTIVNGIPAQHFPGLERMQPMPAFGRQLDDRQIADLVNWLRETWGMQKSAVTPDEVHGNRDDSTYNAAAR